MPLEVWSIAVKLFQIKLLEQCLTHGECSMNMMLFYILQAPRQSYFLLYRSFKTDVSCLTQVLQPQKTDMSKILPV